MWQRRMERWTSRRRLGGMLYGPNEAYRSIWLRYIAISTLGISGIGVLYLIIQHWNNKMLDNLTFARLYIRICFFLSFYPEKKTNNKNIIFEKLCYLLFGNELIVLNFIPMWNGLTLFRKRAHQKKKNFIDFTFYPTVLYFVSLFCIGLAAL